MASFLPYAHTVPLPAGPSCPRVVVGVSDPDLGPLLCRLLVDDGYDARLATDGVAVVGMIVRDGADLLVLDSGLARINGLLTIEVIRCIAADLPAVLLSGFTGLALRRETARLGAVLLEKPFQNSDLLRVLARQRRPREGVEEESR